MFSNTNINNEVLQEGMISLIPNKKMIMTWFQ